MSANDIEAPIKNAPPEVAQIVREVLRVEKENRHFEKPKCGSDILTIIKTAVQ
jgi:hypothetical protein